MVFEGPHGSGKSTQAHLLIAWLHSQRQPAHYLKTPSSTVIRALAMRAVARTSRARAFLAAFLHALDRYVLQRRIRQLVTDGAFVVVDRWVLSSFVYQGIQGLSHERIRQLNWGVIEPDLTVLMLCPLATRVNRLNRGKRRRNGLMFSQESLEQEQIHYESIRASANMRVLVCDGSGERDLIQSKIRRDIVERLGRRERSATSTDS